MNAETKIKIILYVSWAVTVSAMIWAAIYIVDRIP